MKTNVWWYRVGSVVSVLFAMGHTYGFFKFRPASKEGQEVWSAMNSVYFTVNGKSYSYGGFYVGFGLIISAATLFLAALMWWLGSRSRDGIKGLCTITWLLVVLEVVILGFSLCFFGAGPVVLSAITAVVLARAAVSGRPATGQNSSVK